MPAKQERQRWSCAEFARLPDAASVRQEVIAGELVVTPAPTSKLQRYRRYGVRTYWVVDPADETVEVWDLADGESLPIVHGAADTVRWTPRQSDPRLEIALRDLFA